MSWAVISTASDVDIVSISSVYSEKKKHTWQPAWKDEKESFTQYT